MLSMMYVRTMDLVLLYARSANCDGHQSNLIKSDRGGVHPLNGVTLLQYNTVDSTCMHSPIRSSVLQMDRQAAAQSSHSPFFGCHSPSLRRRPLSITIKVWELGVITTITRIREIVFPK